METAVNTFGKGLNRDISPVKYSPENYYDALNLRLITDDSLSSFSLTNEKGNSSAFRIPALQAIYDLTLGLSTLTGDFNIHIATSTAPIVIVCENTGIPWTIKAIYDIVMADATVKLLIADGYMQVFNKHTHIRFVGLAKIGNLDFAVTMTGLPPYHIIITTTVPAIPLTTPIYYLTSVQMRDYLILLTTSGNGDGQIWKLEVNDDGTIKDIGTGNYLVPSKHLVHYDLLNFSTSHRPEIFANYETPEVGKIYFSDNINNLRHLNILDPDVLGVSLGEMSIIPDVEFGAITIDSVSDTGSYTSGMVQYAYQLYNLHGAQSSFSPVTGLAHLTTSSETLTNTSRYYGSGKDVLTGKSVTITISNIDLRFTNIRIVALYYETLNGSPVINVISDREVPASGTITLTDPGNLNVGSISELEFTSIGSVNFTCKTLASKDNLLFPANITESFFDIGDWDARAYRFATGVISNIPGLDINIADNWGLEETEDCIQTKEDQYTYCYSLNWNNTTLDRLGGRGPNLRYYFDVESYQEDNEDIHGDIRDLGIDSYNGEYRNYASAKKHAEKVGYQRDEVYRFGIVWRDAYGRKSFVKWIADIKMPSINEQDSVTTFPGGTKFDIMYKDGNITYINVLNIVFEVVTWPTGAVSYEIVRLKREDYDKTIVTQGLLFDPNFDVDKGYVAHALPSSAKEPNHTLITFFSPETSFYQKEYGTTKIAPFGFNGFTLITLDGDTDKIYKCKNYGPLSTPVTPATMLDQRIVSPGFINGYQINNLPKKFYGYRYTGDAETAGYYGTCLAFGVSTPYAIENEGDAFVTANVIRTLAAQYGGNTYDARCNNQYISCGAVGYDTVALTVHGGDTFIGFFDFLYGFWDKTDTDKDSSMKVYTVLESSINLALRHDVCSSKGNTSVYIQEKATTFLTGDQENEYYTQVTDLYLYNTVYSRQSSLTPFFSKPINFSNNRVFDSRILSSEPKILNEERDSWLSYLATNYIDVDGTYGQINKHIAYNRKIFFFQDKAIGWASVNERSLITPDASGTVLSLGKGGILDQYFYISRHSGSKHQFSVIYSPNGIYYYDTVNNRFNHLTEESNTPISDLKGLGSYLKQLSITGLKKTDNTLGITAGVYTGIGVHGVYDSRLNRVLWTFKDQNNSTEFTIGYNELLTCFESFYSFKPTLYIKYDDFVYSVNPQDLRHVYLHNVGNRGSFYGLTYDSLLSFIINKEPLRAKFFTNAEYVLNTYPESTYNFESIQVLNNYQDTGIIPITDSICSKRGRVYRLIIPRNNKGSDTTSRILSEYAIVSLIFDNSLPVSTRFLLDSFITYYMSRSL